MIYFLESEAGPIKIGFTDGDPLDRMASCQTGSPWRLHLLGTLHGGQQDEYALHERFAKHRMQGEWFRAVIKRHVLDLLRRKDERCCIRCLSWKAGRAFTGDSRICDLCAQEPAPKPRPVPAARRTVPSRQRPTVEPTEASATARRLPYPSDPWATFAKEPETTNGVRNLNLCVTCRQDFGSVSAFDAHRVGKHDYTYSEGVKMSPIREDGRRCLTPEELTANGFTRNAHGRWSTSTLTAA